MSYFLKKLIRAHVIEHEIIWTSFFYFTIERDIKVTERVSDFWVECIDDRQQIAVALRKGKSSDIFVFFQVFIRREYQVLLDFLEAEKIIPNIIIDAGANVGFFSLLLANEFSRAKIVSIEPEAGNVAQLLTNVGERLQHRIKVIEGALWTSRTRVSIQTNDSQEWGFSIAPGVTPRTVEAYTLADIFDAVSAQQIDLLKLDIEGTEGALFSDVKFQNLLGNVKVIAMEIHDHLVDRDEIHRVLHANFFNFFEKGELTVAWNYKLL
ncbi:MAG: FkbM family methyltransferase [Cytophagales bacterium]